MSLQEKDITFKSGNTDVKGFIAYPENAQNCPGVIVIHEIFGLTENIRDSARKLANEGYAALAVDLYSADNLAVCILRTMKTVITSDTSDSGTTYLRSGIDYLSAQSFVDPGRIGAIGFCMGGNFAMALAYKDKRVKTIAPFYGTLPSFVKDFSNLCPTVGSYPKNDITIIDAKKLEKGLKASNVEHEIKIYPGVTHSFANKQAPTYNHEVAEEAWARTFSFFDKHLVNVNQKELVR